jgi:hypothetical protein
MRSTEKLVAVLIVALAAWAALMMFATGFQGSQSNRILLVQLGTDATALNRAVEANGFTDREGIAHNIQMVVRNTYLDFVFIVLYWLAFVGLAYLAGKLGQRALALCAAASITVAAIADVLENQAILVAMNVKSFTDAVAVDISEFSQSKWAFFFMGAVLLGLSMALNRRTSSMRRATGGVFIAAGFFGILGIARYLVSLGFAIMMINLGLLLTAVALLLTLWKFYQSIQSLGHLEHAHRHA